MHSPGFLPSFESRLSELLHPKEESDLFVAARYAALGEGKRIRPRLCIEVGLALGASLPALLDPACSLELIHTSSLIHDDLPCMDDDDYRRGKPSLHRAFGEAHALLTGDFLLVYPFEILIESNLSPDIQCALVSLLSKKIGAHGMILGQHLDLSMPPGCDPSDIEFMYRHKTADLIEASLLSGAIVAKASQELVDKLKTVAQQLGFGYQLHNDLIDHTKLSGRTESSDKKNGKRTLCQMLGRKQVEQNLERLTYDILNLSRKLDLHLPVLQEVGDLFLKTLSFGVPS